MKGNQLNKFFGENLTSVKYKEKINVSYTYREKFNK